MALSQRMKARLTGLLYLIIFLAAPSSATNATPARLTLTLACDTGVALLLFSLLAPVSRSLSLLAATFRLAFVAIMARNGLQLFTHGGAHASDAFDRGYGTALVPFGIHCLLVGILIARSRLLPRVLGALMIFAGLAWTTYLFPSVAHKLFPWILGPGILGEGALTLWLLIMGVRPSLEPPGAVRRL